LLGRRRRDVGDKLDHEPGEGRLMEFELHVVELETERRWNWMEFFAANATGVLGKFISYRDDETFAWMQLPGGSDGLANGPKRVKDVAWRLAPTVGSTITSTDELTRISESPLLEIRRY